MGSLESPIIEMAPSKPRIIIFNCRVKLTGEPL